MNIQQGSQHKVSANGLSCRKADRDIGTRLDNRSQTGKTNTSRLTSTGFLTGYNSGGYKSPSHERLVYLTTCLIGHHVEVQVVDGSVFFGIFHAINAEKDFGIILKMAHLARASSSLIQKNKSASAAKPPSKTLIITAEELVQITAKGVSVTTDGLINEVHCDKQQDIMTDSYISQARHVEAKRELERWVPDDHDRECPEVENIFDGPWNRGWDQFEANKTLFGVKSTFNEEIYTTKLERGPWMRELEKEASRIAREIEGEETQDLHLAEERGIHLNEHLEIDEETRFSSVLLVDDSGDVNSEDLLLDSHNIETFSGVSGSTLSKPLADLSGGKTKHGAQASSSSSSVDEIFSFPPSSGKNLYHSLSSHTRQLSSEYGSESISTLDCENRAQNIKFYGQQAGNNYTREDGEKQKSLEKVQTEKSEDSQSLLGPKTESSVKAIISLDLTAFTPSHVPSKGPGKTSYSSETSDVSICVKTLETTQSANSFAQPGSSVASTADCGGATPASTRPGLSPSSSVGSLSSEKSTLNPTKEFKLNPNAKSFIPSKVSLRPASPVSDSSFYYPANVTTFPHMHGMPVGVGIGSSFAAHQPVIFNPQGASMRSTQGYFHGNGPQYEQQTILGHPRHVLYVPTEMPYKGREF